MAIRETVDVHYLYLLCIYLCVHSEKKEFIQNSQFPSMHLRFPQSHNVQHLFGPVHSGKERVGFDIIHASHTRSQSLHRVVLEQLHGTRDQDTFLIQQATR